jgi:hypothetical protein
VHAKTNGTSVMHRFHVSEIFYGIFHLSYLYVNTKLLQSKYLLADL